MYKLVEISNVFVLCDSLAVFEVQVLEDLTQLRHHTLDQLGVQAHREINVDPQVVPCAEFGEHLCPQAVPYFWWNRADEMQSMTVRSRDRLRGKIETQPGREPWQRLLTGVGRRHRDRHRLRLDPGGNQRC